MAECKGCAGKADIVLPLQEVLTLRVRGVRSVKRSDAVYPRFQQKELT